VVIPTHNRSLILEKCLNSLAVQTLNSNKFEVIVADDGSTDNTAYMLEMIKEELPYDLTVINLQKGGPSKARNEAIKMAKGGVCLIINDDAIADVEMVERHLAIHEQFGNNNKITVVGNRKTHPKYKRNIMNYIYDNLPLYIPLNKIESGFYDPSHFITFNLSASRKAFDKYGFFDEDFKSALAEDTELGIRWANHGCKFWFSNQPIAFHEHGLTVDNWKNRIIRKMNNSRIMYGKHPEIKIQNAMWKESKEKLQSLVKKYKNTAAKFENSLRIIEKEEIQDVIGKMFMNEVIQNERMFLQLIRKYSEIFIGLTKAEFLLDKGCG